MKASFVTDIETKKTIYECADLQHDLLKMMPSYHDVNALVDHLLQNAWLVAITEDGKLLGYLLFEWLDYSQKKATVHVCKFEKCNGLEAWNITKPLIKDKIKTVCAYIPEDRIDVLTLAKKAHFKVSKRPYKGIYYAKYIFD